jgi:hypothetical protein
MHGTLNARAAWKLNSKFITYINFSSQSTSTCQTKNLNYQTAILENHVISRLRSEIRQNAVGKIHAINSNIKSKRRNAPADNNLISLSYDSDFGIFSTDPFTDVLTYWRGTSSFV